MRRINNTCSLLLEILSLLLPVSLDNSISELDCKYKGVGQDISCLLNVQINLTSWVFQSPSWITVCIGTPTCDLARSLQNPVG